MKPILNAIANFSAIFFIIIGAVTIFAQLSFTFSFFPLCYGAFIFGIPTVFWVLHLAGYLEKEKK